MKCKKNNKGECSKNCEYFKKALKEPNKYVCITFPQGLYNYDTVLVDIEKNKELLKELFGE